MEISSQTKNNFGFSRRWRPPKTTSNENIMIKILNDGVHKYYVEMNKDVPEVSLKAFCNAHGIKDNTLPKYLDMDHQDNVFIEFAEEYNLPLQRRPKDKAHRRDMIMDVFDHIVNKTKNTNIIE